MYEIQCCAYIMKVILEQNIFKQFFTSRLPSGDTAQQINIMLQTEYYISVSNVLNIANALHN